MADTWARWLVAGGDLETVLKRWHDQRWPPMADQPLALAPAATTEPTYRATLGTVDTTNLPTRLVRRRTRLSAQNQMAAVAV